jgi:hypothetical protein
LSKKDKLVLKALNNPYGLHFTELQSLCEIAEMWIDRSNGTSHFIYIRENPKKTISIQRGKNGEAKFYQVKQVLSILEELGIIGDE